MIFTETKFEFDYEKERHYIFDFNKSITAERNMHQMLNKPKRGCGSNIGYSNRDSRDKQVEGKFYDVVSTKPVRSDIISYNQIGTIKSKKDSDDLGIGILSGTNSHLVKSNQINNININNMNEHDMSKNNSIGNNMDVNKSALDSNKINHL